jgi:hypothetical protein
MAAITRLAVSNPSDGTETAVFTAAATYLVSVIATNTSPAESSRVYIWVAPLADNDEADRGYVAHHLTLEPSNSYETFKFAVVATDVLYVKAVNGHTSFVVSGINQS